MMTQLTKCFCVASLLLAACSADDGGSLTARGGGGNDPQGGGDGVVPGGQDPGAGGGATGGGGGTTEPTSCKPGREYIGFDSVKLTADRIVAGVGIDRSRMKPFSMLSSEYPRLLGATPASLAQAAATFGKAPARWYEEPEASAVGLQTAFGVAFDGCLTYTESDARFAAAPTPASASAECGAMARAFWSRTPGPTEIEACAAVATTATATEKDARRKWAYACASVLTSAGFLTY